MFDTTTIPSKYRDMSDEELLLLGNKRRKSDGVLTEIAWMARRELYRRQIHDGTLRYDTASDLARKYATENIRSSLNSGL